MTDSKLSNHSAAVQKPPVTVYTVWARLGETILFWGVVIIGLVILNSLFSFSLFGFGKDLSATQLWFIAFGGITLGTVGNFITKLSNTLAERAKQ